MIVSRREALAGASIFFAAPGRASSLDDGFAKIEKAFGGRIGVSAVDLGSGRRIAYRPDERFAMCSTFKMSLAAAILHRIDRGSLALAGSVDLAQAEILPNSPIVSAHSGQGTMTIEALCAAAVEYSDNSAANALLAQIGGPVEMTHFFRSIGDRISRLDRIELELNTNIPGDPRDTTTAAAMTRNLLTILHGRKLLTPASRDRLIGWMLNERNGRNRIRAGVPAGWQVANKPGTSVNGAVNDIALIRPVGRPPIALSIYTNAVSAKIGESAHAIADATRIICESLA